MSITRGDLPPGIDAPIMASYEATIASGTVLQLNSSTVGLTSLGGRTPAGDIVGYRVVNKSTVPSGIAARYKLRRDSSDAVWDGSALTGTDLVYPSGSSGTITLRGRGTRVHGLQVKGYDSVSTGAGDSAVDVHILLWFRGVD